MNNFMQMLGQIKNNPQMINQFKNNAQQMFGNIQGVDMNNPNAIIQYGLNNGRFSQAQYNQVMNFARQFGYKG